jgi:hypothetical protein
MNFIVPIFPFAYKSKPKIGKIVGKLFADWFDEFDESDYKNVSLL